MVGYLAHADERHSLTTEFIAMQYAQVLFLSSRFSFFFHFMSGQIRNMARSLRIVPSISFTNQLLKKIMSQMVSVTSHRTGTVSLVVK